MESDDLVEIVKRYPALAALADAEEPLDRTALGERLDLSKSTVYRIVSTLRERGFVDEGGNGVGLTPLGRTAVRETRAYRDTLEAAEELAPFVDHLPLEERDVALGDLEDARVTRATEKNPMAPLVRLAELTEEVDEINVLTNTVAPQSFDVGRERIIDGELEAHIVLEEDAAETLVDMEWYNESLRDDLARDELTIRVCDRPVPYQLGIMDDTVCLGAERDGGVPLGLLEVDHDEIHGWAVEEFERFRGDADGIDDVFEL